MKLTTTVEFASEFGCFRDEVNNLIKHVFDGWPNLHPETVGRARVLDEHQAMCLGIAVELRRVGISTSVSRALIVQLGRVVCREDALWLTVRAGSGGAEVWTKDLIKHSTADSLLRQHSGLPLVLIPLEPIKSKVSNAIRAASPKWGVDPDTPTPKTRASWTKPKEMAAFQQRQAKASKKEPVA